MILRVNAIYLSTHFKNEIGKSLADYINETRINQAELILTTIDLPIQRVADLSAISDEN